MTIIDRNVENLFGKIDKKLDKFDTKLDIKIDEIKEPVLIRIIPLINTILVVVLGFFTFNLENNIHEINSSVRSSHLVSELNTTLTDKEAKRDLAIIALARLSNPFKKDKTSKIHRAEKNQAYMIYEVSKRLANVAQADYKEAIIKFDSESDKNNKQPFEGAVVESYGLIHRKYMEAGKILDKVLSEKDKEMLEITLNDEEKMQNVFATRASKLYSKAAREVASSINLTDINLTNINLKSSSSTDNESNLEVDKFIDRYSSQTMNELLGNKAPIFIRYDNRLKYYKFGDDSKFDPKRIFPAFMKEVLGRNKNNNGAIDDTKYYMIELYSPMTAVNNISKSEIRYFRSEDRKLAEELQKSLRKKLDLDIIEKRQVDIRNSVENLNSNEISDFSAFKTLSTLIDTCFEPVNVNSEDFKKNSKDLTWSEKNKIDVRDRQLELLIVFKKQQQNNTDLSDNCE